MRKTTNSLFIGERSKGVISPALPEKAGGCELSRRLYHIVGSITESFEAATRRLLRLAEIAHGARDTAALREISLALQAIPLESAQRAAAYYGALVMKRAGLLDTAAAMLEPLDVPRAGQTLATIRELQGQWSEATRLHAEAMRRAKGVDALAVVNARIQLATLKSIAGDHHAALADLESLWPMVRTLARRWPHLFYQLHNEIAVELAAVGQLDGARRACAVALSAPIAHAYPEWHETADELRELERAAIAVIVPAAQHQKAARRKAQNTAECGELKSAISGQPSVASGRRSPITHQPRAPGILERVKRSARDRDGPFVNVK
jgi:hypothetical protein